MRPGRLGPGRFTHHVNGLCTIWRFNEAGAIRPRKARRCRVCPRMPVPPSRFNEAGAIRPRKGIDAHGAGEVSSGFNEAGAIRPRKGIRLQSQTGDDQLLQ